MINGILHSKEDIFSARAYIDSVFGSHWTEYRVIGPRAIRFVATRQAEDRCRISSNIDWTVS